MAAKLSATSKEEGLYYNFYFKPNMTTSLKRIIRTGWLDFTRNWGLSIATVFVTVMVVGVITFLFLSHTVFNAIIYDIQEKMDISVYFIKEAAPEDISSVKDVVSGLPEVSSVEYVSREEALAKFTELHRDDQILLDSLKEVGENPFLASLNVRVIQANQYEQVVNMLEGGQYNGLIDKIDYHERKPIIDKVFSITSWINNAGIILSIILGAIAILLAFNTVRIAIFNASEEVKIMRLVGASNGFIQGPFMVQGIICGLFATVLVFLLTFGLSWSLNASVKSVVPELSTFSVFLSNIWLLILMQFVTGVGVGVLSSLIAIRKYLKV